MKKIFFFTLLTFSIFGCKKEGKIKLHDITQTDEDCNIVRIGNNNDWQLNNFANISDYDREILIGENGLFSSITRFDGYNMEDFNFYCPENFSFNYKVCPNPANINERYTERMTQNINTDVDITAFYSATVDKKKGIISTSGGASAADADYFYPTYGKNFVRYYLVLTNDYCVYYGKGSVIIEK